MNPKRTLHVFDEPLTRKALLAALRGPAAKASILFISMDLEREAQMLTMRPITKDGVQTDEHLNEQSILSRIKKIQPIVDKLRTWGLY